MVRLYGDKQLRTGKTAAQICAERQAANTLKTEVALAASNMLLQIFGAMCQAPQQTGNIQKNSGTENNPDNPKKTEADLKAFCPELKDSLYLEELTSKYNMYLEFHSDWSDDKLRERLINYEQALFSHEVQDNYRKYKDSFEAILDKSLLDAGEPKAGTPEYEAVYQRCINDFSEALKNELHVDDLNDEILNAIVAKNNAIGTEKEAETFDNYLKALQNRGVGIVDLYDTDGDERISFDEFVKVAEEDLKRSLSEDEKSKLKNIFDLINIDSSGKESQLLDADEMANYTFYFSRLHDDETTNTTFETSFKEWYDGTVNYEYDIPSSTMLYEALKSKAK